MRYLNFASGTNDARTSRAERLVIAIDASSSMDESDWKPTRLGAAREATAALIERKRRIAPEDEIAIVSYAGAAEIVCHPVPVDSGASRLLRSLRAIRLGGCTNITAGLAASQRCLKPKKKGSLIGRLLTESSGSRAERCCRILILTDGGHNDGRPPLSLAARLKNDGVSIDCLGIGGSPSDVDEVLLRRIASLQPDGVAPRYAFIGDKSELITKFEQLAAHITR